LKKLKKILIENGLKNNELYELHNKLEQERGNSYLSFSWYRAQCIDSLLFRVKAKLLENELLKTEDHAL